MPRSKKSFDERIGAKDSEIQKYLDKAKQMQAQKQQLERQKKEADRKARTKRLIEIGASVESVLGREFTDGDNIRIMNFLKAQERNGRYFTKAMEKDIPAASETETVTVVS
ncbi:MAG: relaxasome subunit MobC [Lachnospiraceae bacterium]|nr:relaxasome subunit MobC [Lachnospiraceae bacterium]